MELTKRVAVVELTARGSAHEGRTATGPGDAQAPCCPMTLVAWLGFAWN